jgi:hypothetical protein
MLEKFTTIFRGISGSVGGILKFYVFIPQFFGEPWLGNTALHYCEFNDYWIFGHSALKGGTAGACRSVGLQPPSDKAPSPGRRETSFRLR